MFVIHFLSAFQMTEPNAWLNSSEAENIESQIWVKPFLGKVKGQHWW